MATEFIINSQDIETKINQLLPSQGGFGAGVDFSASTMVIPIVDLTESAEGSQLRIDLQSAVKLNSEVYRIVNATNTTIVNTPGYYRLFGMISTTTVAGPDTNINITDGVTTKILFDNRCSVFYSGVGQTVGIQYDFIAKVEAGETLRGSANAADLVLSGTATQIADINGNLT